jgi:hypothetical protein
MAGQIADTMEPSQAKCGTTYSIANLHLLSVSIGISYVIVTDYTAGKMRKRNMRNFFIMSNIMLDIVHCWKWIWHSRRLLLCLYSCSIYTLYNYTEILKWQSSEVRSTANCQNIVYLNINVTIYNAQNHVGITDYYDCHTWLKGYYNCFTCKLL